jgi:mannosyltransferase
VIVSDSPTASAADRREIGDRRDVGSLDRWGVVRRRPGPTEVVAALTLLGAVLRFATLNVQSIERDEAATLILVHRGFAGMLSHLPSSESAPPLYYVLVWAWTHVFGGGPLGFRSFSALVGTITIPVMYAAGREISSRVGIWAAALATVSPALYFWSQQARCYALLVLFSAGAFALWQRALQDPGRRRLALWAGVSILAVLTHYFAAFLFVPEAVVLVRRVGWRRVWAAVGAVVVVGLALLPLANAQRATGGTNWIEQTSLFTRFAATVKDFLAFAFASVRDRPSLLAALLAGLLAVAAVAQVLRRGNQRERRGARDAAIIAVVAIALPLLLAATHVVDVYNSRNDIAVWIPCAVLVAVGLGTARACPSSALLGAGLCAISLAMLVAANLIPAYERPNWRGVAHALATPAAARIVVTEQYASFPLSIYLGSLRSLFASAVSTREVDFVGLRTGGEGTAADVITRAEGSQGSPLAHAGFRAAGVTETETFAISRFVAARATTVSVDALRRMSGEATAEIILQR